MELAAVVTILGLILTSLNILDKWHSNKTRLKQEGAREQVTESDVQALRQGNASILLQLDKMESKMDSYTERLVRVEESSKQAHKRIDSLEGRHGA